MVMGMVMIKMVYSFCWIDNEIRGSCGVNIMSSVQCSLQFCLKLVDIAGRKIQILKIGIINFMVILVIFLTLFVRNTCNYTSYNSENIEKQKFSLFIRKFV